VTEGTPDAVSVKKGMKISSVREHAWVCNKWKKIKVLLDNRGYLEPVRACACVY